MRLRVLGFTLLGLLTWSGCTNAPSRRQHPILTLTWLPPDWDPADGDAARVTFVLGGQAVGAGREGFREVLRRLQRAPECSVLQIDFDPPSMLSCRGPYWRPYTELGMRDELLRVCLDRKLRVIDPFWGDPSFDSYNFVPNSP
jgi:hypothetical protein